MRYPLGLLLALVGAALLAAPTEPRDDGKRFGVPLDRTAYPQSSPREALQSVLKAIDAGRFDYLAAHLADPVFVDDRLQRLHRGRFDELVADMRRRLDPATVKLLRRFRDDGELTEKNDRGTVRLDDVKDRCIYLRKRGDAWYLEHRSKPME